MMNRKSATGGVILLALLAVLPAVGEAANLVKPGDVDAIDIPIENHTDSFMPLKGVRVEVTAPQHFIIKDTSIKGPLEVLPGETKMLTIDYEIAANAPEGEFVVGLKVRMDSGEASPAPASNDSEVSFMGSEPSFLVGAQLRPVWQNPPFGRLKLSERLPYRQAIGTCKRYRGK